MRVKIEDAASAVLEIDVEDISEVEECIWLTTLIQFLEYQHDYWQCHKHYAKNLEALVEDK